MSKHCKICEAEDHSTEYHDRYELRPRLKDKGFPTSSSRYKSAHEQADKAEKSAYPKGYQQLKKIDAKLPKHELAGKNTRSGKIEVSSKVPSKLRPEVAFHEKTENKILRRKK
jgi:hypothetical protein